MGDQPFVYSPERVAALAVGLSHERFATYLRAAGSEERALRLYTWNTAISAALYGPLQTVEVTLRNRVHEVMTQGHGDRWFEAQSMLRAPEQRAVKNAIRAVTAMGREPAPGRIVAELSYGFWVGLFANVYDESIWRTDLFRAFTPRVKRRQDLHESLDRLRTLRNRIAHHEPIFQRRLADDVRRAQQIVGSLSVPMLEWLDHHSTVGAVLAADPDQLRSF